jgi:REP element-mobilizing transposase RayT
LSAQALLWQDIDLVMESFGRTNFAPKGQQHISPWQRPGIQGESQTQALKGRHNGGFWTMSQSLVKNLVHLIYSTKDRQPWIPKEHRDGLFAYQSGIYEEWESPALVIGGVEDHVHACFALSRNHALKKIVEEVKKGSSKWMKIDGPRNSDFYWQIVSPFQGFHFQMGGRCIPRALPSLYYTSLGTWRSGPNAFQHSAIS